MSPGLEHLVAAGVKPAVAVKWLGPLSVACREFGINTPQHLAGFLSQCAHESGGFTMLEENLNYRATTMATVWPKRFAELDAAGKPKKDAKGLTVPNKFALTLERKPELIANVVYSARYGNGPVESGDGFKYRGRGAKQLTFKANYARCGEALRLDLVGKPDLLLEPEHAALSAAWFWSANNCNQFADAGDVAGLTRRINGGLIGLADRLQRYQRCLATLAPIAA